ncbi:MAG TPA: ATP-binding protein [Myxococcota bacterium]|nr:ATP-binding protein [Myxococcota bacterium]
MTDDAARRLARADEVLGAMSTGVLVIDGTGRVEQVNDALRVLLDLRGDPIGRRPVEVVHVVEVLDAIADGLAGRAGDPRAAVFGERDLLIEAQALRQGCLVSVRDVTGQRAAERARTEFVANVSHELRTPIAAIRGFAETAMLDADRLPPDVVQMIAAVQRNGQRLGKLFEDLLTLYRIETRRRDFPRERLRVRPLLEEAAASAAERASTAGLRFDLVCPDGLEAEVHREALTTIVSNLASNACKYTPRGGLVRLSAHHEPDGLHIDVADTGIGISRHHQERIFERFYRVDDGRARAVGGTGLGLAIVKHYAQATGAVVTVTSEEGHGSTFTVRVPQRHEAPTPRTWDTYVTER